MVNRPLRDWARSVLVAAVQTWAYMCNASLSGQATATADGLYIDDLLPHHHGVSQIMPYSTLYPDLLVTSTPHLPSVSVL